MNKIILFATLFLVGFLNAQVSENREVKDFSKLKVSSSIDVFYTISDTKSIKIETDNQDNLQYIKTEVVGETLKLYVDTDNYKKEPKKEKKAKKRSTSKNVSWINGVKFTLLKITVSGPNLDEIKASSSASVKFQNLNTSKNLLLAVSSSATIKGSFENEFTTVDTSSSGTFLGDISTQNLTIESSSSSTVSVEGKTVNLVVKASSSGDCNLRELKAENVTASASSSASISVYVSKIITAKASSSGDIVFYGNPSNVSKEKSSSGSITQK